MKKLVPIEDIEYLAQQSSGQLNMIVAGMTELINSNAEKTAMLENQGWFQRMVNSITGKNKATKEEIRRNHDKINLYVSQALTELYKQNCLDRKIMMSLSNQLNEIYADHLQLKQMLGMFICRLNEKIESVDNFHVLNTEIEQGVYNTGSKIVAICSILSQLDNRSIKEDRKIDIIRRSMEQQCILNDEEKILGDYLVEIAELPIDEVGIVYSEMNTIRANFIANLISNTIEAYHFLPDIKRRTKKKQAVVQNVVQQEDFDFDAPLSTSVIWQELIDSKIEMVYQKTNSGVRLPKRNSFIYNADSTKLSLCFKLLLNRATNVLFISWQNSTVRVMAPPHWITTCQMNGEQNANKQKIL